MALERQPLNCFPERAADSFAQIGTEITFCYYLPESCLGCVNEEFRKMYNNYLP